MSTDNKAMVLHQDYPFKDDVINMLKRERTRGDSATEIIGSRKVTITVEDTYIPVGFSKMYQHTEMLKSLSPVACMLFIHIGLALKWNEQVVFLNAKEVGLDRRKFNKGMLELMLNRVIRKQKLNYYWVNVTIVVVGYVDKDSPQNK